MEANDERNLRSLKCRVDGSWKITCGIGWICLQTNDTNVFLGAKCQRRNFIAFSLGDGSVTMGHVEYYYPNDRLSNLRDRYC